MNLDDVDLEEEWDYFKFIVGNKNFRFLHIKGPEPSIRVTPVFNDFEKFNINSHTMKILMSMDLFCYRCVGDEWCRCIK